MQKQIFDTEMGNKANLELYSGAGCQRRKPRSPAWFQHASLI